MSTTTIGNRLDNYQITGVKGRGCWRHPYRVTVGCDGCLIRTLKRRLGGINRTMRTLDLLLARDLIAEEYATGLDR